MKRYTQNETTRNGRNLSCKFKFVLVLTFFSFQSLTNQLLASDYYWVNGTGKWSEFYMHWATSSGGSVFHTQVPTLNDNVFFDVNSFTSNFDTLNIDIDNVFCNTMDWSLVLNNPVISSSSDNISASPFISIYGSLVLNPLIHWNLFALFVFESNQLGNTINSAGLDLASGNNAAGFQFNGAGSWELMNDLKLFGVTLNNGTFISNDYTLFSDMYITQNQILIFPHCIWELPQFTVTLESMVLM